jgi:transposase
MDAAELKHLPPDTLIAQLIEAQARIAELTERIRELEEQFRLAQLARFAPKSEKASDRMFDEAEQSAATEPNDEEDDVLLTLPDTGLPEVPATQNKRGRRALPAHLPRRRVEHDLPEDQKICPCCRGALHRIGEETSEQLHWEVKVTVLQHARFKYACRHCQQHADHTPMVSATMPAQPLPGSYASASVIAMVMTGKYADGTPLYRMENWFARAGIAATRGTIANWIIKPTEVHLTRLYEAMQKVLLAQPVMHGDETTVQVLNEKDKSAQSKSYMWVYRSAQDSGQPVVLFEYQPGREKAHPQAFLAGYTGLLMTDGYSAWRAVKGVTHFGCMAHARRKFNDAFKAQKKPDGRSKQALEFFRALYQVETLASGTLPAGVTRVDYTYRLRQEHSKPLLEVFRKWLDEQASKVLPKSLIGKALSYTLNQWEYLSRYVTDGRAPIDNNVIERDIRPFTTGRKNWLFSDTVAGVEASAVIYSLMLTCRACNVEPYAYLNHVLTELPQRAADTDISDLLPFNIDLRKPDPPAATDTC